MIRITDFRAKDVVNVSDGKKLGYINDVDLDLKSGKITAILLAKSQKVLGIFGREEDLIIPWNQIVKIGRDVILVKVSPIFEAEQIEDSTWKA